MKKKKIIRTMWIIISFVVVVSMVAWTVAIGF